MKNYKQILEAVRRGIQLALDDYQDIEDNNYVSTPSDVINTTDVIKNYIEFNEQWVDLGLPSKTLWAKSNIGADCDNYAESWYGDYFAWGEIEPKDDYSWEKYKYGLCNQLTKYCTNKQTAANYVYTRTDNLTELQPKDDIATTLFGHHSHIPTEQQCIELVEYTTPEWKKDYNGIKGLNGTEFTGKNGKTLFIPAAGYRHGKCINNESEWWYIWSSTLCTVELNIDQANNFAKVLVGDSFASAELDYEGKCLYSDRHKGYSIRPVYNK